MKFKSLTRMLCAALVALPAIAFAVPNSVVITYKDAAGVGVNDPTPLTLSDGSTTTVGAFRKKTIEHVSRAMSLQFKTDVAIPWGVEFKNNAGYDALTLGPSFVEVKEHNRDRAGIAEVGRWYPLPLLSALSGVDLSFDKTPHATTQFMANPNKLQSEISPTSGQSVFTSIVYHELVHVYGFAEMSCLGNCVPQRSAMKNHLSKAMVYRDDGNVLVNYDALDLDGKEKAGKSTSRLLSGGNTSAPRTSEAVRQELTSGTYSDSSGHYVQLYATPTSSNEWDGQTGDHIAFEVQPTQLMYSSAGHVQDLGIAAAMLCDAGWCRKTGQVIDIKATATLDKNASTSTTTYIDVKFENLVNSDVDKLKANVRLDPKYAGATISGDQQGCTFVNLVLNCEFDLTALSSKKISITTGALSSDGYVIAGEVYSDDFDVDRNGFNNIVDTTLKAESGGGNSGGGNSGGGNSGGGNSGGGNSGGGNSSGGKSGGSMSWFTLALGLVLIARRQYR